MNASYRPGRRILDIARSDPDRAALVIDGESWSYAELVTAARSIAAHFPAPRDGDEQPVTAVMAQRHVSAYAGILAARLAGHAYVPLNVNHPPARNATILKRSRAGRIVCGERAADALDAILEAGEGGGAATVVRAGDRRADYTFAGDSAEWPATRRSELANRAYILFTSGSTGEPKGVPIRNSELESYLAAAGPILEVSPDDRFSQTFDLTFDLSVHDLFVCWENGATLVVASEKELRMPSAYIRRHEITCWFSVPSLAYQVRLQEDLEPGAFPSLRMSLFCGEALPAVVAVEWAHAAPNSRVENWYGPTEATIACSRYVLTDERLDDDTVPIGTAFPGMELLVLDADLAPCEEQEPGELFLAGSQLAPGYLDDPDKTKASFLTLPDGKRVYRTGDRAVLGTDGDVRFLGRVDNQVKVRGYRIELGEVEAALRTAASGRNTVALAWPSGAEIATSIVAALECESADVAAIEREVAAKLPEYMVPSMIFCVPAFPKNASGKVDRKALGDELLRHAREEEGSGAEGMSREARILMESILTHAPLLGRRNILEAKNLFDAGMDSLAFIAVTTDIEHRLGLSLDQDTVIQLAEMSFDEIVREARGETHRLTPGVDEGERLTLLDRIKRLLHIPRVIRKPRANRALQFIERFPGYLAEHGPPDVLAVGTSCTFRAFHPEVFERTAAEHGVRVTSLNAGFPGVNVVGMRMLCEFVRDQLQAAGKRVPLIIYEFDVMHVSTAPPSGDINLGPDFFTGNVISLRGGRANPEFEWLIETSGAWNAPDESRQKTRKPAWARERDGVIARAYLGGLEFSDASLETWLAGASALREVADRMLLFLHPADREMLDELRDSVGTDKLHRLTRELGEKLDAPLLPWEDFDLDPGDYLDINHMNARGGRDRLSRQLARLVFAGSAPVQLRKTS
jgi:amino acid adenylation domain-containing protein